MPILVFSPEQMLAISACAVTRPEDRSPLKRLYAVADRIATDASFRGAMDTLAKKGLIVRGKEGRPRLARALEPVVWILHRPEETLSFARFGARDAAESWFCRSGRTWVRDTVDVNGSVEMLAYPYTRASMATWFAEELIGDAGPGGARDARPKSGGSGERVVPERAARLPIQEWVLIVAMQQCYRTRVRKNVRLKDEALWIPRADLARDEVFGGIAPVATTFLTPEAVRAMLGREEIVRDGLRALVERGLLDARGESVAFSSWARAVFDPGRLLGIAVAKVLRTRLDAAVLYLLDGGYAAVSTIPGTPDVLQLRSVPGTTPKERVFEWLLDGLAGEFA